MAWRRAGTGLAAVAGILLLLAGCGRLGYASHGSGEDAGAGDAGDASADAGCACDEAEVCVEGACLPDGDGDRVPDGIDCDPADRMVGLEARRECMGACAPGFEVCDRGVWAECDAPTDCTCTPGEARLLPCGDCGSLGQRCGADGTWESMGGCAGEGVCSPGAHQFEEEPCGLCGRRFRSRTCAESCTWGGWTAFGACEDAGVCMPGAMETEARACLPGGGRQERARSCLSTCVWDDWAPWGACSGSVCTPTTSRMCGTGGFQRCSAAGTWCVCWPNSDSGSSGGWVGCRGSGLNVCAELVTGYPCYWENHPRCQRNFACAAMYGTCNMDCPAPGATDMCMCPPAAVGDFVGCAGSAGCGVCMGAVEDYPCYFENHPPCEAVDCTADSRCNHRCPAPGDADVGTLL